MVVKVVTIITINAITNDNDNDNNKNNNELEDRECQIEKINFDLNKNLVR